MYGQKKDTSATTLDNFLRSIPGCAFIVMDKSDGFDRLVLYRGLVHIVEYKTVDKPKTRAQLVKKLTPNEHKTMLLVEAAGCRYEIVTTPEELAAVLGVPYSTLTE